MIALRVENLSKSYRIAHQANGARPRYRTLREDLLNVPKQLLARFRANQANSEEFYALRDVNFEVQQGEVLGIIGRNGAGKSTLLKILSRITEPTSGQVSLFGRVASLLEVGTGFHAELTGRENIFLNGAILGMRRAEIARKFDEIVDFAEVEQFLDTPVKRYSSGMYVRLAFAVAAHLEPEILIVDEVLAVGDAEFQKKCLGKMQDVSRAGRTVLFVSHNMGAINLLCSRAILLERGTLRVDGPTECVTRDYFGNSYALTTWRRERPVDPARGISFLAVRLLVDGQPAPESITTDASLVVEMVIDVRGTHTDAELSVRFTNHEGFPVLSTANCDRFESFQVFEPGQHTLHAHIPAYLLAAGTYSLLIASLSPNKVLFDILDGIIRITVEELGPQASVTRDGRLGVVNPRLIWEHSRQASEAVALSS